jgi:hypothetical protein
VYLKKIFRGRSPRTPREEGGERKGREGRRRGGDKGKEEKGGRERRKERKGIRVGREGIGPPQCLTQIDAPGSYEFNEDCSTSRFAAAVYNFRCGDMMSVIIGQFGMKFTSRISLLYVIQK